MVVSKKSQPLVTVIIPCRNAASTIETAIKSVLGQTYRNLEIIVIDDHSSDHTFSIAQSLATSDSRLKVLRVEKEDPRRFNRRGININAGYLARNLGLQNASGEWITFQDADDFSVLNRIEIQKKLADYLDSRHISTSVFPLEDHWENCHFAWDGNIENLAAQCTVINPEEIANLASACLGVLQKVGAHNLFSWLPFRLRHNRFVAGLFFGPTTSYPGGANAVFFHHSLTTEIRFRPLPKRIWPSARGRGADRDFCFNIARAFRTSSFVDVPLYAWRTPQPFSTGWDLNNALSKNGKTGIARV